MKNNDPVTIKFLGTGTSTGIPEIGCSCETCLSDDPRDQRARSCLWVYNSSISVIIDVPQEFRMLCLKNHVQTVNTVLLTHMHADHFFGLDDVRRFNVMQNTPINMYINPGDMEKFERIFDYTIKPPPKGVYRPKFNLYKAQGLVVDTPGLKIYAVPVNHGDYPICGYIIESETKRFAYIIDCKTLPEETEKILHNIDILNLGALWRNFRPHLYHLNLEEALLLKEKLNAKHTFLSHISHKMGLFADTAKILPEDVTLSYDGLQINL